MKRENNINEGFIIEFQNGNFNIKFSDDAIKNISAGRFSDIECLSWLFDSLDTYFVGDHFCLSNYDMGALLYNYYSDKCYILVFSDIENVLMQGKTLKLYSFEPSEDDRQEIEIYL